MRRETGSSSNPGELSRLLLEWYARNARSLPWRKSPADPYAVWVSEIMLQQTQVETVIPYYVDWMARFPDIETLAEAAQEEALAAWEGLGYYSRVRNLHKSAKIIREKFNGRIPADVRLLRTLPGVGRYTAGAIASIAFGMDEPALDGNIRRVLARMFDVDLTARSPEGERALWDLAGQNLAPGRAGDQNQALMDLGAAVCTPKNPTCETCPLAALCRARELGIQAIRPVTAPRPKVPHYQVAAAIIARDDRVLIARRPENGLLGGLWEFPGGKQESGETLAECLRREIREELDVTVRVGEPFGVYRHAYTHFKVTLTAFHSRLDEGDPRPIEHSALAWIRIEQMGDYPMGKIDRQIARGLLESAESDGQGNRLL